VTTEAHPGVRRSAGAEYGVSNGVRVATRPGRTALAFAIAAVLASLSLVWMAGESHYKSCIAAANANFPAVPVSALNGTQTGPLKLSFTRERQAAVKKCGRF
jgi:hypothetical protein